MRICFFIPSLGDGGAQRQCVALLNVLQRIPEIDLHLVLLGSGVHEDGLETENLQIHRVELRNFANPFALIFLVRVLRRIEPDLLLSWLHPADVWSYFATRIIRTVPWVVAERDSAYPQTFVFRLRSQLVRSRATLIIANSPQGKTYWESFNPKAQVKLIPNMVLEPIANTASERSTSRTCLSVGRLEPQKNVLDMVVAFATFSRQEPASELLVVGEGSLAGAINSLVESHPKDRVRVKLLGFRRDIRALMQDSRVLLSFSRHEGMPNVLMEAVSAGIPAVVSDIPEHRSLLGDNYPYFVSLDADPEDAAAVMRNAWNAAARPDHGLYAYARLMLTELTPEFVGQQYIKSFADVARCSSHGFLDEGKRGRSRKVNWPRHGILRNANNRSRPM